MADDLHSNVVINIGIKKKGSEVESLLKDVLNLESALNRLSGKTYEINFGPGTSRQVKSIQSQLEQLGRTQIAVGQGNLKGNIDRVKRELEAFDTFLGNYQKQSEARAQTALESASTSSGGRQFVSGHTSSQVSSKAKISKVEGEDVLQVYSSIENINESITDEISTQSKQVNKYVENLETGEKVLESSVRSEKQINEHERARNQVARQEIRERIKSETMLLNLEKNKEAVAERIERLKRLGYKQNVNKTVEREFDIGEFRVPATSYEYVKELENGRIAVVKIDEASNDLQTTWKENTEELKRMKMAGKHLLDTVQKVRKDRDLEEAKESFIKGSKSEGFKELPGVQKINTLTGKKEEIVRFFKATKTGFAQYEIDVKEFNTSTGIATKRMKVGAEAAKFMGDSLVRASEKVLLWTASTTLLFSVFNILRKLSNEIKELESNSVFLSRVSDRLVSGIQDENTALLIKQKIANELTRDIVELTSVIGGMASEAQHSASVFLRAGETQEETLIGVTASLLAARIAEIELSESSALLQSSLLQFNLEARQLIPTLDTLNTLSNNYAVTTEDLFDSISRTGSVYSEQNGKLSELAALTAVVGETTKRTGSQIGNAFKTVISRLNSSEIRTDLFSRLSVNTIDLAAESKSLGDVLLELSLELDRLSEAEQKELLIKIAGVRQANILIAAINEVDRAIIAQNKALFESGSAYAEYKETAKTLDAALGRLNGEFSQLANNSRSISGVILKDFVGAASGLLKLLNAGDGLVVKGFQIIAVLTAASLASGALRRRMVPLTDHLIFMKMVFKENIEVQRSMALQSGVTSTKLQNMRIAAGTATSTVKSLGRFMLGLVNIQNILIASTAVAVHLYTKYAEVNDTIIDLLNTENQKIKENISNIEKRLDAINSTRRALTEMFLSSQRLLNKMKELDSASPEFKQLKKELDIIEERMENIGLSLDINIINPDDFTNIEEFRKYLEDMTVRAKDAIEERRLDLQKSIKEKQLEIDLIDIDRHKAANELNFGEFKLAPIPGFKFSLDIDQYNVQDRIKSIREEIERTDERLKEIGFPSPGEWNEYLRLKMYKVSLNELLLDIKEKVNSFSELEEKAKTARKELGEFNTQLNEIKAEDVDLATKIRADRLTFEIEKSIESLIELQERIKQSSDVESALFGKKSLATMKTELNEFTNEYERLAEKIKEKKSIDKGYDKTAIIEQEKELLEVQSSIIDLRTKISELQFQSQLAFGKEINSLKDLIEFELQLNKIRENSTKEYTSEVQSILDKQVKSNILLKQIEEAKMNIKKRISEGDNVNAETEKIRLQELLNQLKTSETDMLLEILRLKRSINEEEIKSIELIGKQITQLDVLDKARVISQAKYFQRNPDKKLTFTEQFLLPRELTSLTEKFAPNRLLAPNIEDPKDIIARLLFGLGNNGSEEIQRKKQELKDITGGISEVKIAEDSLVRIEQAMKQISFLETGFDVEGNAEQRSFNLNQSNPVNNLIIGKDAFSLKPFATEFKSMMHLIIRQEVSAVVNELKQTKGKYTSANQTREN